MQMKRALKRLLSTPNKGWVTDKALAANMGRTSKIPLRRRMDIVGCGSSELAHARIAASGISSPTSHHTSRWPPNALSRNNAACPAKDLRLHLAVICNYPIVWLFLCIPLALDHLSPTVLSSAIGLRILQVFWLASPKACNSS